MALAKREAARRNLYSRFFRGPILGPDVHSETTVSQTFGDDAPVRTEKRSKNHDSSLDASTEDSNEETKRQEKLRKKVEKAAKKLRRHKGKDKGEDEQDVDETITPSAPQEKASEFLAFETPHEMPKRKKKNKRRKVTSTSELEIPPCERTLVEEDCKDSKTSRKKRHRRDDSL
jgi:hypothetical protein